MIVQLTKRYGALNAGEIAGFSDELAGRLIAGSMAVPYHSTSRDAAKQAAAKGGGKPTDGKGAKPAGAKGGQGDAARS
jgi:hypothetical protein